jgi:hypothetical protein
MIYNIDFNENFIDLLSEKASDSIVILPSKYLTDIFRKRGIDSLSYDDLWFKILPHRASNVAEAVLVDRAINKYYTIKSQLKRAINEYFYYGLDVKDLICYNSQHDLLKEILLQLNKLLQDNKISLRSATLRDIVNSKLELNFKKPVYAVLPVIFSPLLFEILKLFREKFNFNLVIYGYDETINYNISECHPQYFIREFLLSLGGTNIVSLSKKTDSINLALRQMSYPPNLVYRLHEEKLYQLNHIERFTSKSVAEEFESIASIIETSHGTNISIISRDSGKLKLLYSYLIGKLQNSTKSYKINTSTPKYCYDYSEIVPFFKILNVIGAGQVTLTDIFEILRYSKKFDEEVIIRGEKALLTVENLLATDIKYAEKILEENSMFQLLEIIKEITSYRNLSSIKSNVQLPIELSNSAFDILLRGHLSAYISIISDKVDEKLLDLLIEVRQPLVKYNISYKEYRNLMIELGVTSVITTDTSEIIGNSNDYITIDLLTSIERRFLSYDLTIICDLKEGIWPPANDDHFFISQETRKRKSYVNPSNYEVGYAANDFISIIASSKKVIISELKEAEIIGKDLLKNRSLDSRFLSMLYCYQKIAGFEIPVISIDHNKNDQLKLNSEAVINIPLDIRPKSFSPTSLEKLMRNPYLYSLEYIFHLKYLRKSFNDKTTLPSKYFIQYIKRD